MSTELENEMKEINLEEGDQVKKEEIQIRSKIAKAKRNPFEKIIDESINICDELIEKNQAEVNVDKLIKTLEKEILKKEEFYNLIKLYEKTKRINLEDPKVKCDFNEIKSSLQNIKISYENKKKTINKNKCDDKEKDEKLDQPSKKKKTTINKKTSEILDVSSIVAKLSKIEENNENLETEKIEECKTPVKEFELKNTKEIAEEENNLKSPAQNTNPDLNENKNINVETTTIKISVTKETSAKKTKNENKNTLNNYFKPKAKDSFANSTANSIVKQKIYSEDNQNSKDLDNFIIKEDQKENEAKNIITDCQVRESDNLPKSVFNIKHHNSRFSTLEYQIENLEPSSSQNKIKFYKLNGNDINRHSEYMESFRNYMGEISNKRKKYSNKPKIKKRKVIFIHDSFLQYRKIPDKTSKFINPRNPFKKDEYLIDYDKDSEEEFLEENAEDIKSNDNSADEEEIPEDEEEDAIKWIVPDGHLSEDEVSQKEDLDIKNENLKKKNSVMEILEIRKNYAKPVIVNFNLSINASDNKIKLLQNLCKARIFNLNPIINDSNLLNMEDNIDKNQDYENINNIFKPKSNLENNKFPINITSKKSEETGRKTGINNNIKDKLEELVREIHLSYMTKEYLIKVITEKFNDISKKSLSNFFKDSVLKVKCKNTLRKQWLVKKEILENANFLTTEYNQLLEKQNAIFEEKEKEKKKEIEENQINNQNILNEQRGLNFTNFDLNASNNFNLNNLNYNQPFTMRNVQVPSLIENNLPPLNNQFNIQNYNVNLNINNNNALNNILNSKEKSKTKRIKKEKGSPTKSKNKSAVKLNKSYKKDSNKNTTNDQKFDLSSFSLFPTRSDMKKKDSFNS